MSKRKPPTPAYDWSQPSPVSDVDVAFPARALEIMPTYEECEAALELMDQDRRQKFKSLQRTWFYSGLPKTVQFWMKPGVDGETAFRHLKVIQGSFAPKHEHKEAAFIYLASLWIEDYSLEGRFTPDASTPDA